MKSLIAAGIALGTLALSGCSNGYGTVTGQADTTGFNGNPGGSTPPPQPASSTALFHPSAGLLPYPTDLYFFGSTDGTLNIHPLNPLIPNQAAVNALDGFSTNAVIRERFGGALDPASLQKPGAIIIVPVTTDNQTKATTGVLGAPLKLGTDFSAATATDTDVGPTILEITPLHPLQASTCISGGMFLGPNCTTGTGYLVILTSGISDASGNAAVPDTDYATIKAALPTCTSIADAQLNGICKLTGAHLLVAQALGLSPANIVLTFSFTTESTVDTLELLTGRTELQAQANPPAISVHPTGFTTHTVNPALPGIADVYVGVLTVPYYLSAAAPLTEYWHATPFPLDMASTFVTRFNPLPVKTQDIMIPVLVTVPNAASGHAAAPPGGWPVLIFAHDRGDIFAMADSFAQGGFVVVAIDLPLHGVTDKADPLYAAGANPLYAGLGLPAAGSIERTFDLDLVNNATGAPGPDGVIDPSGMYFINLKSVLTTRDNLRQGVADLVTLALAVPHMSLAGGVNPQGIHYLGHPLGGIVGGAFLGVARHALVSTGTLASPGGELAQLLRDSPTFAPVINAALAASGLQQGTTLYEQFFRDAQTVLDAVDPINFIALATAQHPIHLIQVVGGATMASGATFLPDQVVRNSATARLIAAGGFTQAHPPGASNGGAPLHVYVNFTAGTHASVLDPTCGFPPARPPEPLCAAATIEMQTEAIAFATTAGTLLPISAAAPVQ